MRYSKYGNKKAEIDGETFDSIKEANRWVELKWLEKGGVIKDLKRQVKFELLPTQRVDGKVVERPVTYIADFTYMEDGKLVAEDTKGFKPKEYVIKRKLMLYIHGIQVRET